MQRILPPLCAIALLVSACAPLNIYHQAGVSVAKMERDQNTCAVKALTDVPVNTQIRQAPPRYIPGRRICDAQGNCRRGAGHYVPGPIYSVDVNKRLRSETEAHCMASKGYSPVTIPQCAGSVAASAPANVTTRLPRLSEGSCVIRNPDGTWQIVAVKD